MADIHAQDATSVDLSGHRNGIGSREPHAERTRLHPSRPASPRSPVPLRISMRRPGTAGSVETNASSDSPIWAMRSTATLPPQPAPPSSPLPQLPSFSEFSMNITPREVEGGGSSAEDEADLIRDAHIEFNEPRLSFDPRSRGGDDYPTLILPARGPADGATPSRTRSLRRGESRPSSAHPDSPPGVGSFNISGTGNQPSQPLSIMGSGLMPGSQSSKQHRSQNSIDSMSSASIRRRSLAFLASAISLGSMSSESLQGQTSAPSGTSQDIRRMSFEAGSSPRSFNRGEGDQVAARAVNRISKPPGVPMSPPSTSASRQSGESAFLRMAGSVSAEARSSNERGASPRDRKLSLDAYDRPHGNASSRNTAAVSHRAHFQVLEEDKDRRAMSPLSSIASPARESSSRKGPLSRSGSLRVSKSKVPRRARSQNNLNQSKQGTETTGRPSSPEGTTESPLAMITSKLPGSKLMSRRSIFRKRPRTSGSDKPDTQDRINTVQRSQVESPGPLDSPALEAGGLGFDFGQTPSIKDARPGFRRALTSSSAAGSAASDPHSFIASGQKFPSRSVALSRSPSIRSASRQDQGYLASVRGRSNSLASLENLVNNGGQPVSPRTSGSRFESSGSSVIDSSSRLDHAGGAAALFGGGSGTVNGGRSRTSSLIPGLPFLGSPRLRTLSAGGNNLPARAQNTVTPPMPVTTAQNAMEAAAAAITAKDTEIQNALRKASASNSGNLVSPASPEQAVQALPRSAQSSTAAPPSALPDALDSPARASGEEAPVPPPISVPSAPNGRLEPYLEETPEEFMERASHCLEKSDLAAALASHADPFYAEALNACMRRFQFAGNALDIALRKLLMELCLPRETQQIDRVMEAFAKRYTECNEGLFLSHDQPYILAFSLMMLHTDAFNRNAKQKMSKSDYVRNASSSEVAVEILEYLYDNITFTQFIYVDGDPNLPSRKGSESGAAGGGSKLAALTAGGGSSSKGKIDAYLIISQGRTHELSPDIEHLISEDSPFSLLLDYKKLDTERLRRAFTNAPTIEIVAPARIGVPPGSGAFSGTLTSNPAAMTYMMDQAESVVTLKVTKVGVLNRRDDLAEGGTKKASKKWRQWGLILTSAQLLFFKDTIWTGALQSQIADQAGDVQSQGEPHSVIITPRITYFRPDTVLSLSDAIAVCDDGTIEQPYAFRLYANQAGQARQFMVQAQSQEEMLDWMVKINYCGAFRSVGIRRLDAFTTEERLSLQRMRAGLINSTATSVSRSSEASTASFSNLPNSQRAGALMQESALQVQRRLEERVEEIEPKLLQVDESLQLLLAELEENLRLARHFAIMTPFLKSTRERIESAAVPLANKIRRLRLEAIKAEARRAILANDFDQIRKLSRAPSPLIGPPLEEVHQTQEVADDTIRIAHPFANLHIDTQTGLPPNADDLTPMYRSSQESEGTRSDSAVSPETPARPAGLSQTSDSSASVTPIRSGGRSSTTSSTPKTPEGDLSMPSGHAIDAARTTEAITQERSPPTSFEEQAADWHATAAAPEKRVSLATLPSISANDMETLTRAHKIGMKRVQKRASLTQTMFVPPNLNNSEPGPFE